MKLLKLSFLVLFSTFLVAACSSPVTPTANQPAVNPATAATPAKIAGSESLAEARQLYGQFCSNCHQADGSGGAKDFGDGNKPLKVPTLLSEGKVKDADSEFIEQINEGGDGMPAYKKKLNEAQVKGLVAYIRELQKK